MNLKQTVAEGYGKLASCSTKGNIITNFICSSLNELPEKMGKAIGYSKQQLESVQVDANMGIGCGNPLALSIIKTDDTVLDLGCGAGFDCFLASPLVGAKGKVIGVDLTPEMIEKAKANARKGKYHNVNFMQGDIENVALETESVDLVISNCVINMAPNKQQVFNEIFRVLKPGGQMMISDVIITEKLPEYLKASIEGLISCLEGQDSKEKYVQMIKSAGLTDVEIKKETPFPVEILLADPIVQRVILEHKPSKAEIEEISKTIISLTFSAFKSIE